MENEGQPRAEELLRLLASSANTSRLYPASSSLPGEAIDKFVNRSNEVTAALGSLRFVIEPHGFTAGDDALATGQNQVTWLAETLHAMQVGQLVLAPGITCGEAQAFVHVINSDPVSVRQRGVRTLLAGAGVTRIAVIEVSLRTSDEAGILGLDLANVPLEDIGREALAAAETWARTADEGAGHDDVHAAIGRLEEATRDIAAARVAEALLQLDEATRLNVLTLSLKADSSGRRMRGMFDVVARMRPTALARLLALVAARADVEPLRLMGVLELPAEVLGQLSILLAPSPRSEAECGVPEDPCVYDMAREVAEEESPGELQRQVALASPTLASGRALQTTVAISRSAPTPEAVRAIGEALAPAARDGAFEAAREALRRLDELAAIPALALEIEQARVRLQDPGVLTDVCRAPMTNADAAMAGEIIKVAGVAGAEALLSFFLEANEVQRSLFGPVIRSIGEPLLTAAGRLIRTEDSPAVIEIVRMLPIVGDRRAIPVITQALENLDAEVRRAAVTALADMPGGEGRSSLASAVSHWDPETRRFVIREIGRAKAIEAVPALIRILEDINFLERNHELKKEVIKSLESLGSTDAQRVLRRWANRRFVFGRKNKELRFLAQRALAHMPGGDRDEDKGVDTP